MVKNLWQHYSGCWSASEEDRVAELAQCVTSDVVYRDPASSRVGSGELS